MADTMRHTPQGALLPENEARLAAVTAEEPVPANPLADLDDAELDFLIDQMEWLVKGNIMGGHNP